MNEFDIEDVVLINGFADLYTVTGVIHDQERLFITGADGVEKEVNFVHVERRWVPAT